MTKIDRLDLDVSSLSLADADEKPVPLSRWRGKTLVLFSGGRDSADLAREWGMAFKRAGRERDDSLLEEDVEWVPMAVVGKLPFFVPRAVVRALLKKESGDMSVVDWDGSVAAELGVAGGNAHVLVIDRDGRLRMRVGGEVSPDGVEAVISMIDELSGE